MENNVNSGSQRDVLIIGAGPSGLSLGYHLQKLKVDYLILEQNDAAGSSWRQMPDHLHLITLWKSNYLLKEDFVLSNPNKAHSANEFADYLSQFAANHKLNIKTQVKVEEVKKENDLFNLVTSKGNFKAKLVVDCRGYFHFPFTPNYPVTGTPPLMMHFKDYKNKQQFDHFKNILIVGKRLSGGQLITELASTKNHRLFLSSRSKITFSSPPFFLNHYLRNLNIYEAIAKKLTGNLKKELQVPMNSSVLKIIEDEVDLVGDILKIEDKKVTFTDGKSAEIDAIIFATGFKPLKVHLKDDFESQEMEGLFYLGRGSQRNFTSRFIRGIREDANVLGNLILGRLASSNKSQ